jgi:hypothetical protein
MLSSACATAGSSSIPAASGSPGYYGDAPVRHVVQTGTPDACYAILEQTGRGWTTAIRYVPYDHAPMAEQGKMLGRNWQVHLPAVGCGKAGTT